MFATIKKITDGIGGAVFPILKKNSLINKIESIKDKLDNKVIRAYEDANTIFSGKKFKDKTLMSMDERVRSSLSKTIHGFDSRNNMITCVLYMLKKSSTFINAVNKHADKIFSNNEPTSTLKLRQAYIIVMVNNAEFVVKYSLMLLNYIYSKEMCAVSDSNNYVLVTAVNKKIADGFETFVACLRSMNIPEKNLAEQLERISEYYKADQDSTQALMATQGIQSIDPMRLGFLTDYSPFYVIGMWKAEIDAWFVNTLQDEIEVLTQRRIRLEQLYAGRDDAFADKEIDMIQERLDKAYADMDDYKRRYGL